jgi:DMSO/TMAO reductase YedYZ molybdopterin-dependent catalytic subunit
VKRRLRNHFQIPALDPATWRLRVGGHVDRPLSLHLRDLTNMRSHTLVVTLECAGNGRAFLDPPTEGEKWGLGAVSTAEWTGVPLVEVLDRAGVKSSANEVVFRGAVCARRPARSGDVRSARSVRVTEAPVAVARRTLTAGIRGRAQEQLWADVITAV